MPYLYTVFHEASTEGLPVCRPAFFADPVDPDLRDEDDSFLLGGDIAVIARTHPTQTMSVPVPFESWQPFAAVGTDLVHPELPQLRLRPGAILPLGPIRQYVDQPVDGPLELLVHLDQNGRAIGWLYHDDGQTFEYRAGSYVLTRFDAQLRGGALELSMERAGGDGDWSAKGGYLVRWLLGDREVVHPAVNSLPISVSPMRN